jgi:hypothetical protein
MKNIYSIPVILILLGLVMVSGCISGDQDDSSISEKMAGGGYDGGVMVYPAESPEYAATVAYDTSDTFEGNGNSRPSGSAAIVDRKTIKSADVSLKVDNATAAAESLEDIAVAYDGYVSSSSVYDSYDYENNAHKQGYVFLRIPVDDLDSAVEDIKSLGDIQSESSSEEDVTEEYIDLDARLSNLKKQEVRLLEILNMTTAVEEVIDVERELSDVRGDIESLQGRMNYLNSRIDMASVSVYLTEPAPLGGSLGIRDAFSDAVQGFIASVRGIIVFIGYALPVAIVISVVGAVLVFAFRRRHRG